jgi:hypothetical protein
VRRGGSHVTATPIYHLPSKIYLRKCPPFPLITVSIVYSQSKCNSIYSMLKMLMGRDLTVQWRCELHMSTDSAVLRTQTERSAAEWRCALVIPTAGCSEGNHITTQTLQVVRSETQDAGITELVNGHVHIHNKSTFPVPIFSKLINPDQHLRADLMYRNSHKLYNKCPRRV